MKKTMFNRALAIVHAVQLEVESISDDPYIYYEMVLSLDLLSRTEKCFDDSRIGGANLKALRELRKIPGFKQVFRSELKMLLKRMAKNPRAWGFHKPDELWTRVRKYPKQVTRKARPASRHRHCAYCGMGYSAGICGACKEAGIDGPVIPGTQAAKATTYTLWRKVR